jgi:hypothetical protein
MILSESYIYNIGLYETTMDTLVLNKFSNYVNFEV